MSIMLLCVSEIVHISAAIAVNETIGKWFHPSPDGSKIALNEMQDCRGLSKGAYPKRPIQQVLSKSKCINRCTFIQKTDLKFVFFHIGALADELI